jgi:SnoaL-like protein
VSPRDRSGPGGPGASGGSGGSVDPHDHLALSDLSVRYAAAADSRDGAAFAGLFEPDGELVVPTYPEGFHPVVTRVGHEQLHRVPAALDRYAATFHVVANLRFDVDGDAADGTVQCIAHHVSGAPPEATDTVWFIRYEDDYRRREGWWRFRRRVLHLQWVEHHRVDEIGPPWTTPSRRGDA